MKCSKIILLYVFLITMNACSRSGHRKVSGESAITTPEFTRLNVVPFEKINGVYQIPIEINEIPMRFIFDTGAGMISISETEALFLYKQGKLNREDITGSADFTDANGNISKGTTIILKKVKIGNRILEDIPAAVVHNLKAPLLLGQSAMEKFGKMSIDYQKKQITLE